MTIRPSDPIRLRLREALYQRQISQRKLAAQLEADTGDTWTQSRLHKVLTGRVELRLDDLARIAAAAGLSLVDLVREPGRELVADLTPTELRLIHALRDHPAIMRPLVDVVATLTPTRKPPRAILRERMRLSKREDD